MDSPEYGWGFAARLRFADLDVDWVDVTQPAAGAVANYQRSSAQAVRVLAARASLTTDANAANRLVSLDFVNTNASVRVRNPAAATFPANTTAQKFEWNDAWHAAASITNGPNIIPVNGMILDAGFTIRFAVDNIQVGDQLSGLSLVVLTIPTGAGA